jgi:alkyl sulfatase BDS1-like metallo-beta-lactamase superfamily hydrolase
LKIVDAHGRVVWDFNAYRFLDAAIEPDTVNPSLYRQARLNNRAGLFKVTDRIYQVRGYDLANMTLIEGETGWIVIDPLSTVETAKGALELAMRSSDIGQSRP